MSLKNNQRKKMRNNLLAYLFIFFILFGCNKKNDENKNELQKNKDMVTYDIVFQKDEVICALRFEDMKIDTLVMGTDPSISYDGKKLAYTEFGYNNRRHVVIYDFSNKQKTAVNITNDNNYGGVWSPNSKLLAFNIFKNNNWVTGVVNKENTVFNFITSKLKKNVYSPSWLSDSKRIAVHDLEEIYIFDLDGNILDTFSIKNIVEGNTVSSATSFIFTSDEKNIIYSVTVDESFDLDEPLETLFCYNLQTKKNIRIIPEDMFCMNPIFVGSNGQIFFSGSYNNDEHWSIYKISLNGGIPELLLNEASSPSLALQ